MHQGTKPEVAKAIFQNFYNLANRVKACERAPAQYIHAARQKFIDPTIDIRRMTYNDKPYWTMIRWLHPKQVLGKLADSSERFGLDHLPQIVMRFMRDDGMPRDITERDIQTLIRIPENAAEQMKKGVAKEHNDAMKLAHDCEANHIAEMLPRVEHRPTSYGTGWMVEENERRIKAGVA